jgi:hypothetical protein
MWPIGNKLDPFQVIVLLDSTKQKRFLKEKFPHW